MPRPPRPARASGQAQHRGFYARPRERFTVEAFGRLVATVTTSDDAYRIRRDYAYLGIEAHVARVDVGAAT